MKKRNSKVNRRKLVAFVALAFIIGALIMMKAQAQTNAITIEPKPGVPQPTGDVARQDVVSDSSRANIEIGLTYHGDILEFFGTLGDTGADAVIAKLTSPVETVKLNQMGRVGPFWMNTKQHKVENIPYIYKIHASQSLDSIIGEKDRLTLGVGFDSIKKQMVIHTTKGKTDPADMDTIFNGMITLKKKQNLYKIDDASRITVKNGKLFKHYFTFPPAAKEGDYIVETYLFRQGKLVGQVKDTIHVKKVGIEAMIVRWARDYPKSYGLLAVIIALSAGMLVGMIFKGGGH